MSVSIYFAKQSDTPIASESDDFINALESNALLNPDIVVLKTPELADIVLLDEKYSFKTWHYADELALCSFVRDYAKRIMVVNHDSYARVHFPGLYVSLEKSRASSIPTLPIPYKRDLWQIDVPSEFEFSPRQIYAFRGTYHTHPIRKKICKIVSKSGIDGICEELRKAFHSHDKEDQVRYIYEILNSQFSICPRGISPSSYRLYESMQLGRCPIVVSDEWLPPHGPDWNSFAIFIKEKSIEQIPRILEDRKGEAEELGKLARSAWQDYFSWPKRWSYFLDQMLRLHSSRLNALDFDELQDIWRSKDNKRLYDWTLRGRIEARSRNLIKSVLDNRPVS